jgi:hypothetical protein
MIYILLSTLFLCLAAVCNAVMDICSHKFTKSIFAIKKDFKFLSIKVNKHRWWTWWNTQYSWRNKYVNDDPQYGRKKLWGTSINYPVQLTDAWHLFKTLMIIFTVFAIVIPLAKVYPITDTYWMDFIIFYHIKYWTW